MEFRLKDGKFFLLDAGKEKIAYASESEAINGLKKMVGANDRMDPNAINVFEVNTNGDKWGIKQISWSKIAMELIKRDDND